DAPALGARAPDQVVGREEPTQDWQDAEADRVGWRRISRSSRRPECQQAALDVDSGAVWRRGRRLAAGCRQGRRPGRAREGAHERLRDEPEAALALDAEDQG